MKINIYSRWLIFSLLVIGFWSCSNGISEKVYPDLKAYSKDVKKEVKFVSQKDFKKILKAEGEFTLLDCREVEEYSVATIPGAVNIPRGMIEFSDKIQNRHIPIYVFSDREDKSVFAAASLKLIKYAEVKVIQGNFEDWKNQYPEDVELEPGGGQAEVAAPVEEEGGCGG